MDLDDIAFLVGIVGVDVLAEFGLGKHLARVQHHVAQQAEFDAAERVRDAIADYRLAVFVQAQSVAAQDRQELSVAATNQGLQASHQFLEVKGFGQIVVGAGPESFDFLVPCIAAGKYQYRHQFAAFSPVLQDLQAGALGQAEIEDHAIVIFLVAKVLGIDAISGQIDGETALQQVLAEPGGQLLVVFSQQYAHCDSRCSMRNSS